MIHPRQNEGDRSLSNTCKGSRGRTAKERLSARRQWWEAIVKERRRR